MLSRDFNCFKGFLGRRQASRPPFGGDLKVACREKRAENVSKSMSDVELWMFIAADICLIQAKVISRLQADTRQQAGGLKVGKTNYKITVKFVLCRVRPTKPSQTLFDKNAESFLNSFLLSNPKKKDTKVISGGAMKRKVALRF